jgi:nitrogen regulatory protein P-II 2
MTPPNPRPPAPPANPVSPVSPVSPPVAAAGPTHLAGKKLLVLIAEAALEKRLVADALRLGAHGYTVHDVRGGGRMGPREALWEADKSVEVKVICEPAVADAIGRHVLNAYAAHYSITLYFADVGVLRAEKF